MGMFGKNRDIRLSKFKDRQRDMDIVREMSNKSLEKFKNRVSQLYVLYDEFMECIVNEDEDITDLEMEKYVGFIKVLNQFFDSMSTNVDRVYANIHNLKKNFKNDR